MKGFVRQMGVGLLTSVKESATTSSTDGRRPGSDENARPKLSPASRGSVNSMKPQKSIDGSLRAGRSGSVMANSTNSKPNTPTTNSSALPSPNMPPTIRPVASFEGTVSDTSSDAPSIMTKHSAFSSSVNSTTSGVSVATASDNQHNSSFTSSGDKTPNGTRLKRHVSMTTPLAAAYGSRTAENASPPESVQPRPLTGRAPGHVAAQPDSLLPLSELSLSNGRSSTHTSSSESSSQATVQPPSQPQQHQAPQQPPQPPPVVTRISSNGNSSLLGLSPAAAAAVTSSPVSAANGSNGAGAAWDSSIGKAGLGKTGRVINKLVSDNEALRREMKLERLRADEARQAARLLEDRLDRLAAEHEARLLEMSVNATLLARKERQVETLTQTVELERTRAREAAEREKSWREEAERVGAAARRDVDAALERAALADGRYNAIASHWKEQGEEVQRALAKMRAEIRALVEERARDDERICVLRDVCEQQESNVRELERQKQEILASFAAYKDEQERQLRDIKREAAAREEEQERRLAEAKSVLGELRWALNVKRNVKGAGEG